MTGNNESAKRTRYILYAIGDILFVVGGVFAGQGTTEIDLFIIYVVMVFGGLGLLIAGQKIGKRPGERDLPGGSLSVAGLLSGFSARLPTSAADLRLSIEAVSGFSPTMIYRPVSLSRTEDFPDG